MKNEAKQKIVGYVITALGLVAGLAWNEAVKSLIDYLMPLDRDSILLKFVYAFSITLIVVLVSTYLARLASKDVTKEE